MLSNVGLSCRSNGSLARETLDAANRIIAKINIRLLIRVNLPSLCIVPQNPVPAAITIMVICIMNEIVKLPVIMYQSVPSGGEIMYVSNERATKTPYTAS